jgi:hypothetical protein
VLFIGIAPANPDCQAASVGSERWLPLRSCRDHSLNHTGPDAEGAADLQDAHAIRFKLAYARLYGSFHWAPTELRPLRFGPRRSAFTRSRIIPRSNSANTPSIWNIALPAVVDVSSPC